jgi:hypothetical protein
MLRPYYVRASIWMFRESTLGRSYIERLTREKRYGISAD